MVCLPVLTGVLLPSPVESRLRDPATFRLSEDSDFSGHKIIPSLCTCVSRSVVSDFLQPHGLYSPAGSSIHGILPARVLEWIASPFSMESS